MHTVHRNVLVKKKLTDPVFSLKFKDPSSPRYEVKLPAGVPQHSAHTRDSLYTTEYQSDPFGFIVRRKSSGRVM